VSATVTGMGNLFSRPNGSLTPTPRVDKNGRTVIRHMKPEASAISKLQLPAPTQPRTDPLRDSVVELVVLTITGIVLNSDPTEHEQRDIEEGLRGLSFDALNMIIGLDRPDSYSRLWVIYDDLRKGVGGDFTSDFLHLSDALESRGFDEMIFSDYIRGFRRYEGLPPLGIDGEYPLERLRQCTGIIDVTACITDMIREGDLEGDGGISYAKDEGQGSIFLRDAKLRKIIMNSEYDNARIMNLIKERKVIAPDALVAILDQDSTPLADGAL